MPMDKGQRRRAIELKRDKRRKAHASKAKLRQSGTQLRLANHSSSQVNQLPLMVDKKKSAYPVIRIVSSLANPGFTKLVEAAVERLDLSDSSVFDPAIQFVYRRIKEAGAAVAVEEVMLAACNVFKEPGRRFVAIIAPNAHIGRWLMNELKAMTTDSLFPYNDLEVSFQGKEIVIGLSSMMSKTTPHGRIYYSRKRLEVQLDGTSYTLAFSEHAISRICERRHPTFDRYVCLADAHALFSYLNYVNPCKLADGHDAIEIYDMVFGEGHWGYREYYLGLLDDEARSIPPSKYGMKLGYCTVVPDQEFLIATTFLMPGYSKTPEYARLHRSSLPHQEKRRLSALAQNLDMWNLINNGGFEVINWFHNNGCPQIIVPPVSLFDLDYLNRKLGVV